MENTLHNASMFDLNQPYPYFEEVNDGILREFQKLPHKGIFLDVGCGQANLAFEISKLGWQSWGIENNPAAADKAQTRLQKVLRADLNDTQTVEQLLAGQKFDAIIFSDVLEHVADPLTIVRRYKSFLKPNGLLFVSLPNFANWENRLRIFFGQMNYVDTGVLDRTHLRFFTVKTAQRLLQEGGFEIVRKGLTPHIVRAFLPIIKSLIRSTAKEPGAKTDPTSIIQHPLYKIYLRVFYPIEIALAKLSYSLFAFRIILVARNH